MIKLFPYFHLKNVHRDAEKHFSFMNKSFNTLCNLTKFSIFILNESTLLI